METQTECVLWGELIQETQLDYWYEDLVLIQKMILGLGSGNL